MCQSFRDICNTQFLNQNHGQLQSNIQFRTMNSDIIQTELSTETESSPFSTMDSYKNPLHENSEQWTLTCNSQTHAVKSYLSVSTIDNTSSWSWTRPSDNNPWFSTAESDTQSLMQTCNLWSRTRHSVIADWVGVDCDVAVLFSGIVSQEVSSFHRFLWQKYCIFCGKTSVTSFAMNTTDWRQDQHCILFIR